jgi:hypothetical protein
MVVARDVYGLHLSEVPDERLPYLYDFIALRIVQADLEREARES